MEGVEEPVIYQGQLCFEPRRDPKPAKSSVTARASRYEAKMTTV
jgi:hypothetical protein